MEFVICEQQRTLHCLCAGCRRSLSEALGGLPGNFYTLVTGANERRWGKVRPRLEEIAKSFTVVDRFAAN